MQTTTSPLKKRLTAIVWLVIFGTLFLMGRVEADETRSPNVLMICIDDLNDFCIWSDSDRDIERILPVVYWLEAELEGENK